uniref:Uncharacterized protein n=1 Tax=Triticum urartu TaxID=4572 RepID=A0A8R7V4P4_TRIUA
MYHWANIWMFKSTCLNMYYNTTPDLKVCYGVIKSYSTQEGMMDDTLILQFSCLCTF